MEAPLRPDTPITPISPVSLARPIAPSTTVIRTMYGYLAVFSYLLYGMGYITPYLRDDLHLTDSAVGLHATALAFGGLAAGLSVDALTRRLGRRRVLLAAVWLCGGAALLVVAAPVIAVSLAGAFLVGFSGGTLGTNVNITLGGSGDASGRKLLARANAWAMASAIASPLVIASAASVGHAWRLAMLLAIAGLLLVTVAGRRPETANSGRERVARRLQPAFWPAWLFVVLAVAIEFSFVFWASTLISARTGISTDQATFLASLFVAGMLAGRVALGMSAAMHVSSRRLVVIGLSIAAAGAVLAWLTETPAVAGVGLFLGGAGTGALYPLGVAVALETSPGAEVVASARLTMASGVAILAAPSVLGVLSDAVGVVAAWPVVLAFAAAALALGTATTRTRVPAVLAPLAPALEAPAVVPPAE